MELERSILEPLQSAKVVVAKHQVSSDLAGEAVILNLKAGVYYGLDEVGARVWNLLQEPRTVAELCDLLRQEYQVDPERCQADLLALLQGLAREGLVEICDGADA